MDNIRYLPPPRELTPEQQAHWEKQLEDAERAVEHAKRMLGRLALEEGIQ
jgi:hypothetical protein